MDKNKKEIIEIGKFLWEKDLVTACSGNISLKTDKKNILITSHNCSLGILCEDDIIKMDLEGNVKDKKTATTEKPIHLSIHKEFSEVAVIHVHPPFTNGYFSVSDTLDCLTFESRLLLGDVPCVPQDTPAVTNIDRVIEALKNSNIVVLKNHGVIAIGDTLRDAFFLIQMLEDAVKVNAVAQLYSNNEYKSTKKNESTENIPTFEMFSEEHIKAIVDLVNKNEEFLQQAKSLALRTKLAVKMDETDKTFCFSFEDGRITNIAHSDKDAEFVISGPAIYWRKIFNRELDPFVATTQKKLKLKGDFGKIARWYAPFNKLFEIWKKVGVK
ncbi:MAG: class II aldolase/adducin family protein [Candidatus Omnitrophica bacterium]|nr:class II aldolase/adducin family protein [Candidatus Omnitrophota bacterium]